MYYSHKLPKKKSELYCNFFSPQDSPTSKLLYNKEVQGYKSKVRKYYSSIRNMPKIPEDAMEHYLRQLSEVS